jgi:hypothetical protein
VRQQLYEASAADYLLLRIFDHNRLVVPSAATASIWISGEKDVSVASAAVSAGGDVTYIPGATVLDELAQDCVVEWAVIAGGISTIHRQLFDVVHNKLFAVATDEDLIKECGALRDERYMARGVADSGSTTTLVDSDLIDYPDDHWTGGVIQFTDGTNAGLSRPVSDYVQSTGTVTWVASCASSVDTTTRYCVRRTFQPELDRSWEEVDEIVRRKGFRPALVMDSDELKSLHVYITLSKICRVLSKSGDDVWWSRAKDFDAKSLKELNGIQFVYDADEDSVADDKRAMQPSFRR